MCLSYMQIYAFLYRDLSIHGFWYPRGSWKQSPADTEGQLYLSFAATVLKILFSPSGQLNIFLLHKGGKLDGNKEEARKRNVTVYLKMANTEPVPAPPTPDPYHRM